MKKGFWLYIFQYKGCLMNWHVRDDSEVLKTSIPNLHHLKGSPIQTIPTLKQEGHCLRCITHCVY